MSFLSPLFLWFLPMISIPLLIYLFNRNKYKNIRFSTLMFFDIIDKTSLKKINIINVLLLIIRTLIILLLVLMISRPIYKPGGTNNVSNDDSLLIIGIDNSFSMSDEIIDKSMKLYLNK